MFQYYSNNYYAPDVSFGDTSSPLVRSGILPPVEIGFFDYQEPFGDLSFFADVDALAGNEDGRGDSMDSDNWLSGLSDSQANQQFVTHVTRTIDDTRVFVYTPANEEGVVKRIVEPDGTVTEHFANGDKVTEFANQSDIGLAWSLEAADGSNVYEYADGSRVVLHSDGTTTFEHCDDDMARDAA